MQKYLVVGCGGSGAKTQAYMIDQLKAYLRQIDPERSELPAAWQFVTIDVPIVSEKGPDGLANVQQTGGQYISIGSQMHYNHFDQGLSQQLGQAGALGEIATWAPRQPEQLNTPISDGAGQYRGIGRMLTIGDLGKIHAGLTEAVNRLTLVETNEELNHLNYQITGRWADHSDDQPVVLVVGSMAGGSGASMAFDVARLLSTMPLVKPAHTAVFMVTPEIFGNISADKMQGAWANSLAMFGEAFAAQVGAGASHDREIFRATGLQASPQDVTFGRLFPIGARMGGQGSRFGDGSANSVYRGLARALAALMASEKASIDFKSYTLANTGSQEGDRSVLGWGTSSWDGVPWGSMGFAQLSMGRDRYAEYSAQRLARSSFDKLLHGHMEKGDESTGQEQLQKRLRERFPTFLTNSLYPQNLGPQFDQNAMADWVGRIFSGHGNPAVQESQRQLSVIFPNGDGQRSNEWADMIEGRRSQATPGVEEALRNGAYDTVHAYADEMADRFIGSVEQDLARYGIPYVEASVRYLSEQIHESMEPTLGQLIDSRAGLDPMARNPFYNQKLRELGTKAQVKNSGPILQEIIGSFSGGFRDYFLVEVARRLRQILEDFRVNVLGRLQASLSALHADLDRAADQKDASVNLADVATDEPTAWPRDGEEKINDRFRGSANEIVISNTDKFASDYEVQLQETMRVTVPDLRTLDEAISTAVREIVNGEWDTQGSQKAPQNTVCPPSNGQRPGNRTGWISKHLTLPTSRGGEKRESRPANFDIKLRPEDLIERSRMWVHRPAKPFANFIEVDLRSYLERSHAANDAEHAARVERLRNAFQSVLALARPLAAVNTEMLGLVYGAGKEEYHYNFSEIPFEALAAKDELRAIIEANTTRDSTTLNTFDSACTTDRKVFSIDVFGSYPNYSPVVFSSLFPHIARDWSSRGRNSTSFWSQRRARPLPAALPMTDVEREAMVAGWHVGMLTGHVYIANQGSSEATVHIWDEGNREWVAFPSPMLTPPQKFFGTQDWLPAVLESILLAYAQIQSVPSGGRIGDSLRPYRLLRELYDTGRTGPTTGVLTHAAVVNLANWLRDGKDPQTGTTRHGTTIDERYEAAKKLLQGTVGYAANFVRASGHSTLPGASVEAKPFANVTDRRVASKMPMYRDLADDVDKMLHDLLIKLDEAKQVAQNPVAQGNQGGVPGDGPSWSSPSENVDATPQLPQFGEGML